MIRSFFPFFFIINFRIARETLTVGEDGKYLDITTIKDDVHQGKALVFELEETIRLFLKDAHRIGIPRSQGRARTDVELYLKSHQISAPKFKNLRPGKTILIIVNR